MPSVGPNSHDAPNNSLWRDSDFLKFWASQSVSNLGQMMMAISLITILLLEARPYQMALLGGATTASGLISVRVRN